VAGSARNGGARQALVKAALDEAGTTFAEDAGITLRDTPSPLYRLLVLSVLLSARISSELALSAARGLAGAGLRTPRAMAGSTWQQRVRVLGDAGYRRFDERTATMLGDGAQLVLDCWGGDLRRLHAEAGGDVGALRKALQKVPGIGPVGSAIFCREVQGVWPDLAPFVDDRVRRGAQALGLPTEPAALAGLVDTDQLPALAAACVRASLDDELAARVSERAGASR
jgi:hypothetical protein